MGYIYTKSSIISDIMPDTVGKVQEGSRKNKYWFWPLGSFQSGLSTYDYKYEAGKKTV